MKLFRNISRILVGLVFVFSGFVKGIDPLGFTYRLEDYFQAFGMSWALPFALYLTIFLCTVEFMIGVSLLLNLWIRGSAWWLLGMMIFFTLLTFFDAVYNMVPDCGCFGDAIKLTNLQTFLKNLIMLVFVIPVFTGRKKFKDWAPKWAQGLFILIIALIFFGISVHSYRHLPMIDFMSWKVGNKVNLATKPVKFFVTYKNKNNAEEKEYLIPDYPWNDSVWMSQWIFVSQRVEDPNKGMGMALRVEDEHGSDITPSITENPDFQFILVSYDLMNADTAAFHRILPLYKQAVSDGYSFLCLTSSLPAEIKKFRMNNGLRFNFYNADDAVLKTMVRSNPGLVLIRNGMVLAKWGKRDLPTYAEFIRHFKNQ